MQQDKRQLTDVYTLVHGRRWYARMAVGAPAAGLPVVLVHGFGISSSYFVPTAERLAAQFDVYAPDLPGHGKSHTPAHALDVPQLADALLEWLAAFEIERAAFVANSMGCQTAVELAIRRPDVVERLVLIGPTVDREARRVRALLPRFVAGGVHERRSMTLLLARDYWRMGPRLIPELRFMLAHRIEERLPLIRAPVLLVRGEHDRIAPQRWLDELASRTPNARLAVIAGGAHAAHFGAADALLPVLAAFLRGTEHPRAAPPAARVRDAGPGRPLNNPGRGGAY